MPLVSVRGNPKVVRCTRCNSFVSAANPGGHTQSVCDARIYKKNNPGPRKQSKNKKLRLTTKRKAKLNKIIELAFKGKGKSINSAKRSFGL